MNSGQSFANPWQILLETVTANDPQIVLSLKVKDAIRQLCHNSDINAPRTKHNLRIDVNDDRCGIDSLYDDLFFLMVAVLSDQSLKANHDSAKAILEQLCPKPQLYQSLISGFPQVGLSDLKNLSLEYMSTEVDNCYGYAIFVAHSLKEILTSNNLTLEQEWLMLRSVADYNRRVFSCFALAIPVLRVLRVADDNDAVCRELLNLILNQESSLSQRSFDEAQRVWRNEILSLWGAADQIDPETKKGILWQSLFSAGKLTADNITQDTLAKIFTLCARVETIDDRVQDVFPLAIDFMANKLNELSHSLFRFFRAQQNFFDYVDTIKGWLVPNRDDPPYALALYCSYRKGPILDCEYSLIREHLAQLHEHLWEIANKISCPADEISKRAMNLIKDHLELDLSNIPAAQNLRYYEPLVKYKGVFLTNNEPQLLKIQRFFKNCKVSAYSSYHR